MCQEGTDNHGGQGGVDSVPVGLGKTSHVLCVLITAVLQGPGQREVWRGPNPVEQLESSSGVLRAWRGCFEG